MFNYYPGEWFFGGRGEKRIENHLCSNSELYATENIHTNCKEKKCNA